MSTKFIDRDGIDTVEIENVADTDSVWITTANPYRHINIEGKRSEFLAAVAAELDVIVIPRADLPKVTEVADEDEGVSYRTELGHTYTAGFDHRAEAIRRLAVAEYLDAHPPAPLVDEAEVDALAWLLASDVLLTTNQAYSDVARRLLATRRIYLAKEA